jgi:hypothetical protein
LFEAAAPLLKRYRADLEVGHIHPDPHGIIKYSGPIMLVFADDTQTVELCRPLNEENTHMTSVEISLGDLYPANKIITNLISTLTERAQQNKDKIKELQFAKRFITALCNDIEDKN